jgi:hypothetical protein
LAGAHFRAGGTRNRARALELIGHYAKSIFLTYVKGKKIDLAANALSAEFSTGMNRPTIHLK